MLVCRSYKAVLNSNKEIGAETDICYNVSRVLVDLIHKFVDAVLAKAKPASERPTKIVIEDLNAAINLMNCKPENTANSVEINACGDHVRRTKKYKISSALGRRSRNQSCEIV